VIADQHQDAAKFGLLLPIIFSAVIGPVARVINEMQSWLFSNRVLEDPMRLARLSYDELSPPQKAAWDEVVAGPRKKMHGPFFIWLHSPELLSRGEKLGLYARFQSSLPQRLSELCILMIAAHWKAAGEWIDHAPIARELGVESHALEALRKGLPAEFKNSDERAAYELAQELLNTRDVSDATYARVKAVLGERAILDLVAVLGYYSLIAMSMKTFALQAEGIADPFKE
jgi:4-carboxymuconolactone decarboxylase